MKAKTLIVRAAHPSRPCPKYPRKQVRIYEHASGEKRDRSMIYADEEIEVADVRYYRRRIYKGDLELVKAAAAKKPKPKSEPKETKRKDDSE